MPLTDSPHEGRHVDIGDTRLFVVERGQEGYPLVCLHGGPGLDHWLFADYLDGLAPDVRVVLVDQRGHGMSDPAPAEQLTLARYARDVVDLARALELDEYAVLGHSFGGFVAQRLAVDDPGAASALVLVATSPATSLLPSLADRASGARPEKRDAALRWTGEHP